MREILSGQWTNTIRVHWLISSSQTQDKVIVTEQSDSYPFCDVSDSFLVNISATAAPDNKQIIATQNIKQWNISLS
jgi:hypothetical protein